MGVTKAMTRHLAIFTTCPERIATILRTLRTSSDVTSVTRTILSR